MNRGNLAEDPKSGLSSSSRYSHDGGERNSLLYVDSSSVRKERKAAERRAGNQGGAIKGNHNSRRKKSVGRGLADSHMDRLEVGSDGRLFSVKESHTPSTSQQEVTSKKTVAFPAAVSSASSDHTSIDISAETSIGASADARVNASTGISTDVLADSSISDTSTSIDSSASSAKNTQNGKSIIMHGIRPAIAESMLSDVSESEDVVREKRREAAGPSAEAEPQLAGETQETQKTENSQKTGKTKKPERQYLTQPNPLLSAKSSSRETRGEKQEQKAVSPGFFHRFRIPIIVSITVAASIGYGYTAWHYRNRFYPGTTFFGIPAAEQSVYDVKAAVKAKVDSYRLKLDTRNPGIEEAASARAATSDVASDSDSAAVSTGTSASAAGSSAFGTASSGNRSAASENVITAEDVGMVYSDRGEIDNAMKQQKSWAWPVMMIAQLFGKTDSLLETSYEDGMVSDAVDSLACMQEENMIKPQDAKVILTDDGAVVQTEIYGTTLDRERTMEAVRKALNEGSTQIDLDNLGLYVNPKVNSSDLSLVAKAMAMNKVLGAKVLVRFGNRTEVINSEVISKFLDKKDNTYTLNEDKVRAYVGKLARKYDTLQCEREFFTSIGTEIKLEEGIGDYGWQIDQEATSEKLLDAIRGQKKTTINPVYLQEAYCRDANDIGDTYVEISLTNQTMWFYKNGKLVVETPVVTGNPYAGHETPSGGVWSLKGKSRNQTLVGQGYASPVDYWMPFNNGVGIHDMQSRWWFGGSIYLGSGSHGCVNTPLSAVKLIYDQIEDGVPVVVYKDESDTALSLVTGPTDVQTINAQIEETYGTVEDDGVGSIVAWSRSQAAQAQAAQAQAAQAQAQTQAASTGTSAS